MLSPDQKGTIAEAAIIARAVQLGVHVYRPVNDGLRWDLLFGSDAVFLRVQCKWARRRGDVVMINTRSCRRTRDGFERRTYSREDIDVLAAYSEQSDAVYLIPPDVFAGHPSVWLRLAPTRNNQRAGIRWAADFEFGPRLGHHASSAIAQLGKRGEGVVAEVAGSRPAESTQESATRAVVLFE